MKTTTSRGYRPVLNWCLIALMILAWGNSSLLVAKELRILCYNVRNSMGMDDVQNLDRTAGVINILQPDLVALQELDNKTARSKGLDILQELAKRTRMQGSYGKAIDYQGGGYGVGILSREKPQNIQTISLPGREEKRCLLKVEFDHYIFCCTHFSLTEKDRIASVDIINNTIKDYKKITFLAGDFNATPESEPITTLSSQWTQLSKTAFSFPSDIPSICIDYIFAIDPSRHLTKDDSRWKKAIRKQEVVEEPVASDHRPLFIILELNDLGL